MSRQIDMSDSGSWSDEDKLYLAQRDLLPTDVVSVEDQRKLLDPELSTISWDDRANTGDVNTDNLTKEELVAALEKRGEEEDFDPRKLFTKEGKAGALAEVEDSEVDDYESWTKDDLLTELGNRNDQREADGEDPLPLSGNKADLVARLREDDGE